MNTLRFDSEDLALTEDFLSRAYTKMRIGGTAEHTRAQVSRDAMGSTSIDRLAFAYDMSHDAQPIGKICLGNVHAGSIVRQHVGGTEGSFGPGDVFLYAPHDRGYRGVIQSARYNLIMFEPTLLDQVAEALPGRGPKHVRLTGDRPVSPAAGRHLRQTIAYLRDHVLADPAISEAPLIVSTASQLLAASVLNTFPNNALTDPTGVDRPDAHPAALRRAVAFIDDNADSEISAADIAAAARAPCVPCSTPSAATWARRRWAICARSASPTPTRTCWPPASRTARPSPTSPPAGASCTPAASPPTTAAPTAAPLDSPFPRTLPDRHDDQVEPGPVVTCAAAHGRCVSGAWGSCGWVRCGCVRVWPGPGSARPPGRWPGCLGPAAAPRRCGDCGRDGSGVRGRCRPGRLGRRRRSTSAGA